MALDQVPLCLFAPDRRVLSGSTEPPPSCLADGGCSGHLVRGIVADQSGLATTAVDFIWSPIVSLQVVERTYATRKVPVNPRSLHLGGQRGLTAILWRFSLMIPKRVSFFFFFYI